MNSPLELLQKKLTNRKIDALLISQPDNRRFISGYSALDTSINESSGHLLVHRKGTPILLTDSRFQLHATAECPDFEIILYPKGLLDSLSKLISSLKIKNLAFESDYFLYSRAQDLIKIGKNLSIEITPAPGLIEKLRLQKNKIDQPKIRKSVILNEKVFKRVYRTMKPGVTEISVALQIEATMKQMGAERPSFETIVASGPNGASPHAVPTDRIIKKNEPIVIDMGLVLDGLCSDMTRTIVLGKPDKFTKKIFRIVRKSQLKAAKLLKANIACKTVDNAARSFISKNGYGKNFGHGLGHGVGYAVHEPPSLGPRSTKKLAAGMVVTIEPGIYIPEWGGVRLENMYIIKKNGYELLNQDSTFLDIGIT
jgi:Xaa-Pro aminopeptidase